MTQDKADLARKIAALMAKADGTDNEHEASAFMAKARKMMEQHALDEDAVRDGANPHSTVDIIIPYPAMWYKNLAIAAALYYGAQSTFRRTRPHHTITLYGRKGGVITAAAMIPYLWKEVVRTGNGIRPGQTPSNKRKAIRMVGDALALRVTVAALAQNGIAKELDESQAFLQEQEPSIKTEEHKAAAQTYETIAAAKGISIHLQATAQSPEKLS